MRALLAEFTGTFVIVLAGCGAIAVGRLDTTGVAIAFGLAVVVMIYGLGHISGAHFNPAVSIGFAIGHHFPWRKVATYAAAQIGGAIAAAAFIRATLGEGTIGVVAAGVPSGPAMAWEIVLTAVLMLVITAVATDERAVGPAAAVAIGGAVALGALVGGPISGAALNPARAIGPALIAGDLDRLWVSVIGPIVGAIVGALLYRAVRGPTAETPG